MSMERRHSILAILKARDSVRVSELRERLGVSDVTIRKDLDILEEQGAIVRTHGGAMLAELRDSIEPVHTRRMARVESKRDIARAALPLIQHGETIYLDAGSSAAELAELVADMELRVVTNSLQVLNRLAERPGISLFMVGGSYRHSAGSFIGPWAEDNLARVQLDHAFIGATGISLDGRFSSQNSVESQSKRLAISAARTAVVIADRSKIGVQAFSVFASSQDIDVLITDADADVRRRFEELGIHVIGAGEGADSEKGVNNGI